MGKGKIEITGGMSPTFISRIAKSKGVSTEVENSYKSVKAKLEAKASAVQSLEGKRTGKYHYGSKRKGGAWGGTWMLWAITETAKDNTAWVRAAISATKNITKKTRE